MKSFLLASLLFLSCATPKAGEPTPAAPAPTAAAPKSAPAQKPAAGLELSADLAQETSKSSARINPFGVPEELDDGADFFHTGPMLAGIATPQSVLNAPIGKRPAHHEEVVRLWREWARVSPRVKLEVTGRTHEGRELLACVVTSERNMARLDEIMAGLRRLADPRGLSDADARTIVADSPAVAWMAYSIHGDEMSASMRVWHWPTG
jgi:hypothetical protein